MLKNIFYRVDSCFR